MTETNFLRDPAGVQPLEDQLVFVSRADDPKVGYKGLIGPDWEVIGILNDDSEVGLTRTIDESTAAGTGFGVISYQYKAGAVTGQVEVLDENEVLDYIKWPESEVKDGTRIVVNSNKVAMLHVLTVNVNQDGTVSLRATREKATARVDEQGRGSAPKATTVTFGYRPDKQRAVFEERRFKIEEGKLVELDVRRFVKDADITKTAGKDTYQLGEGKPADETATPSGEAGSRTSVASNPSGTSGTESH